MPSAKTEIIVQIDSVLQLIKTNKNEEDHFFKRLGKSRNPIPWLSPLYREGYFDPRKDPAPVETTDQPGFYSVSYWNVLDYLVNVASVLEKSPEEGPLALLMQILDDIVDYQPGGDFFHNFWTNSSMVKLISKLPINAIKQKHIDYVARSLNSKFDNSRVSEAIGEELIPRLLARGEKGPFLSLLEEVLHYKKVERSVFPEYSSIIQSYRFRELIQLNLSAIARQYPSESAAIALKKIRQILDGDKTQFSGYKIPSVTYEPHDYRSEDYEYQLVLFTRTMLEAVDADGMRGEIQKMLNDSYEIIRRLAIHLIGVRFSLFQNLFFEQIKNPLLDQATRPEVYSMLKKHSKVFDGSQIERILEWIEAIEVHEDQEETAFRRKTWLSALLQNVDPLANESYKKYDEIAPGKIVDQTQYYVFTDIEEREGAVKSDEILSLSNDDIVRLLNSSWKVESGWELRTTEQLGSTFKSSVAARLDKFTADMKPFHNLYKVYQHSLLSSLWRGWLENKSLDKTNVIQFVHDLFDSTEFWVKDEKQETPANYAQWIISDFADFVQDALKKPIEMFTDSELTEVQALLVTLVARTKGIVQKLDDIIGAVLNAPKGKIVQAMLDCAIFMKSKKNVEKVWQIPVMKEIVRRLNRSIEDSLEYSVVVGGSLQNLYFLDPSEAAKCVDEIYPLRYELHWKAAFTGYLFYANTVYKQIYDVLSKKGHYARAFAISFQDIQIRQRLIQHLGVAYLNGWEVLADESSLISLFCRRADPTEFNEIIAFVWSIRDETTPEIEDKVKSLWRRMFAVAEVRKGEAEYATVLSNLTKWLSIFREIDPEIFDWLKSAASYSEKEFNSPFLIEYLNKHVERQPHYVGEIFLGMIKDGFTPDFDSGHIRAVVEQLFKANETELAKRICNTYLSRGSELLRDIFAKNTVNENRTSV